MRYVIVLLAVFISLTSLSQTYDFERLDAFIDDTVTSIGGGCALILVNEDSVIYRKGYGDWAANPDTVVEIASATKWLSGAVLMSLVEDGIISLEDTVGMYLPLFSDSGRGHMTIAQCFSHTAGMAPTADYLRDSALTLEQCVDSIAMEPLTTPVGYTLLYGGLSMQVVGRICEVATGEPWDSLFVHRVTEPLGMPNTQYNAHGETDNPHIGGGVTTNIDDLGNFVRMVLANGVFEGDTVLDSLTLAVMQMNHTDTLPIGFSPWRNYDALDPNFKDIRCGIGVWREFVVCDSLVESSSAGGNGCYFWVDHVNKIGGAFTVDRECIFVTPVIYTFKHIIRQFYNPYMINPPGRAYADPELHPYANLFAYQDEHEEIWLSEIDSITGYPRNIIGRDHFVDDSAAILSTTFNGPEFGVDSLGWSIFYTVDTGDTNHIARATFTGSSFDITHLTSDFNYQSAMVSKNLNHPSTDVLCVKGTREAGAMFSFNEDSFETGEVFAVFTPGKNNPFWTPGKREFLTTALIDTLHDSWQIVRRDIGEDITEIITNDPGDKTWPSAIMAPEFGHDYIACAVHGDTAIAIYRDTSTVPDGYWELIGLLQSDLYDTTWTYGSPEFFIANDTTYVSCAIKRGEGSERVGHVWVFDIDDNPATRFAMRCDDGADNLNRSDPEPYVGEEQVFIFYNVNNPCGYDLYRYPTGIATDSHGTGIDENSPSAKPEAFAIFAHPNPFNSAVTISVEQTFLSVQKGQTGMSDLPVTVEIFDVNGRKIKTLRPSATSLEKGGTDSAPLHKGGQGGSYVWQPDESVGSGVYLVRATFGPSTDSVTETATKRVVYLK